MGLSKHVNDLKPRTFGTAHFGVNGGQEGEFDATDIRPFGNLHHLSGIIHVPTNISLVSGVIRFSQPGQTFEISLDGGISFQNMQAPIDLQTLYNNGRFIITKTGFTSLQTFTQGGKLIAATTGAEPPIRISGLIPLPLTRNPGDLGFNIHSENFTPPGATTVPNTAALSLGIGTLHLETGSGIVPLRVGSGICQLRTVSNQTMSPGGINITLNHEDVSDLHYPHSNTSNPAFVMIAVPGLYRVSYNVCAEKLAGTNRVAGIWFITLNNATEITRSRTFTYHRNTTNPTDSAACEFFQNFDAGDTINIEGIKSGGVTGDTIQTIAAETWLILERIGPKRGSE